MNLYMLVKVCAMLGRAKWPSIITRHTALGFVITEDMVSLNII